MTSKEYTASKVQPLGGVTSLAQQVDPMATAKKEPLYKTYGEFFAGNPEAQKWSHYQTSALPESAEAASMNRPYEGPANTKGLTNPWQFAQQYNQYTAGLPREYQLLAQSGLDPSRVESGEAKRVWDAKAGKMLDIPLPGETPEQTTARIGGSGSTHSLSSDVLNKMWR